MSTNLLEQTETIEKELGEKVMKMKVATLNTWIKDAGYNNVRAISRTEANDNNIIFKSSLGFVNPSSKAYNKTFNQIVSEILRINVISIKWSEADLVEINYLDI